MKRVFAIMLTAALVLCVCGCMRQTGNSGASGSKAESVPQTTRASSDQAVPQATRDHVSLSTMDEAEERYLKMTHPKDIHIDESYFNRQLRKNQAELQTEELLQEPELPTGCESVALTMALRTLNFDLEKTDFAEQYLTYGEDVMWDYVGDPTDYYGAGIFPPGLTNCANNYLAAQRSNYVAYNTMGVSFTDLLQLIEDGYPVLLWTTLDYEEPLLDDFSYTYEGKEYFWYELEHCVMLCGYDLQENTVTLNDPMQGIITIGMEQMQLIYDSIGRLSMTVKDNKK